MRVARSVWPGITYHLIWRFVDRSWFFETDDERTKYLALLGRALGDSDWRCFAFALMSNHIHLACIAGCEPLDEWSTRVNSPFARWMNKQRERLGPVMADRPRTIAFARAREAHLLAYIHNNPVRAGVVRRAAESTWTSHRFYVHAVPPSWLHVQLACERMGIDRGADMDAWVNATPGESGELELQAMRKIARRRGAVEVATPLGADVVPLVRRPEAHVRVDARKIVWTAAAAAEVEVAELCSRRRSPRIVAGRFAAVRCAMRLGVSGADIASALALSSAAVSNIKRRTASELEGHVFDLTWARLEVELAVQHK